MGEQASQGIATTVGTPTELTLGQALGLAALCGFLLALCFAVVHAADRVERAILGERTRRTRPEHDHDSEAP